MTTLRFYIGLRAAVDAGDATAQTPDSQATAQSAVDAALAEFETQVGRRAAAGSGTAPKTAAAHTPTATPAPARRAGNTLLVSQDDLRGIRGSVRPAMGVEPSRAAPEESGSQPLAPPQQRPDGAVGVGADTPPPDVPRRCPGDPASAEPPPIPQATAIPDAEPTSGASQMGRTLVATGLERLGMWGRATAVGHIRSLTGCSMHRARVEVDRAAKLRVPIALPMDAVTNVARERRAMERLSAMGIDVRIDASRMATATTGRSPSPAVTPMPSRPSGPLPTETAQDRQGAATTKKALLGCLGARERRAPSRPSSRRQTSSTAAHPPRREPG